MVSNPAKPASSSKTMRLMIVKSACFFIWIRPVDVVHAMLLNRWQIEQFENSRRTKKKKPTTLDRGFSVFSASHSEMDFCAGIMH